MRTGGKDQPVIGQLAAVGEKDGMGRGIDVVDCYTPDQFNALFLEPICRMNGEGIAFDFSRQIAGEIEPIIGELAFGSDQGDSRIGGDPANGLSR
jgi:hypothetical protein